MRNAPLCPLTLPSPPRFRGKVRTEVHTLRREIAGERGPRELLVVFYLLSRRSLIPCYGPSFSLESATGCGRLIGIDNEQMYLSPATESSQPLDGNARSDNVLNHRA